MKQKMLFLAVASMLAVVMGNSWGAVGKLPFADGFEDGTSGNSLATPWAFTDVGRYDSSQETVDGSTNTAYFSDEGSFVVDTNTYGPFTNVWCKYYAKITTASSDPTLDADTVAGFYINASGTLRAYNGTAWEDIKTGLTTSGWMGLSVHLDYTHKKWDIYRTKDGFTYGDGLEKLNTTALAFNSASTATEFSKAVISGTTYIDQFAVNKETQLPVTDSTPTNAANAAEDIILGENLTGVLTKYFSQADSTLDGPLGEALANALLDTDKVYVYLPGSAGGPWQSYLAHGPGQALTQVGGSAGLGITITPRTAIFVDFNGSGERKPARVTAYDTPQPAGDITLYGTDSTGAGWNAVALPLGAANNGGFTAGAMHDMGSFTPADGDQVWIKSDGGTLLAITYDSSTSKWKNGRRDANGVTITPGQSFWYYRNASGQTTWDASGITIQ